MYTCACFVTGTICCPCPLLMYVCCFVLICREKPVLFFFLICKVFVLHSFPSRSLRQSPLWALFIHHCVLRTASAGLSFLGKLKSPMRSGKESWWGQDIREWNLSTLTHHLWYCHFPSCELQFQTKELPIWSRPYNQEVVRVMLWHQWALDQHISSQCWGRSLRSFLPQQPL